MPKYVVHIGNRELEVQAPSAQLAVDAAMAQYPGEIVAGYGLLSAEDAPETPPEAPDSGGNSEGSETSKVNRSN